MIDTHIHLYADEFDADRDAVIKHAQQVGVTQVYLPNIDEASIEPMHALARAYPDWCKMMMGLHPCYVYADWAEVLNRMEKLMELNDYVAVGEIGMDLYWDKTYATEQALAFERQLGWARNLNLPIAIHTRSATHEIVRILKKEKPLPQRGVFHCFSGSLEEAKEITGMGYWLGIGGVITFKSSKLGEVLKQIPLSYIVLETDGPYLAPTPFRGKRNEPAYLRLVAEQLSAVYELPVSEIITQTTANANRLFQVA